MYSLLLLFYDGLSQALSWMPEAKRKGGGGISFPWLLWIPLLEATSQPQFLGQTALVVWGLKG